MQLGPVAANHYNLGRVHFGRPATVISQAVVAELRGNLGATVYAGKLGITLLGKFSTLVFFYLIRRLTDRNANTSRNLRI